MILLSEVQEKINEVKKDIVIIQSDPERLDTKELIKFSTLKFFFEGLELGLILSKKARQLDNFSEEIKLVNERKQKMDKYTERYK